MTKQPEFPPDDFDLDATLDGPSGVHRAPVSAWSKLWPWLTVFVCFALLGVLVAKLAAQVTDPEDWPTFVQPEASQSPTETPEPAPSTDPEPDEQPTESPVVTPEPTQEPEPEPEPEPDFAAEIEVLNAAGITGLAAFASDQLTDVGFTTVAAGNHQGPAVSADTVFYGSEDLAVTAELVAETLGLGAPQLAADRAPTGIVVVLVSDIR